MGGGEYPQMYPHSMSGFAGRVGERSGAGMPDNFHIGTCRISSGGAIENQLLTPKARELCDRLVRI